MGQRCFALFTLRVRSCGGGRQERIYIYIYIEREREREREKEDNAASELGQGLLCPLVPSWKIHVTRDMHATLPQIVRPRRRSSEAFALQQRAFLVRSFRFRISGFLFSVFCFRFSVFGFRFSCFGYRFSGFGLRHPFAVPTANAFEAATASTQFRVYGFGLRFPGFRVSVLGFRFPVLDCRVSGLKTRATSRLRTRSTPRPPPRCAPRTPAPPWCWCRTPTVQSGSDQHVNIQLERN